MKKLVQVANSTGPPLSKQGDQIFFQIPYIKITITLSPTERRRTERQMFNRAAVVNFYKLSKNRRSALPSDRNP